MNRKSAILWSLFLVLAIGLAFSSHVSSFTQIVGDTILTGNIVANFLNVEQVDSHSEFDNIDMSGNRLANLEDPIEPQDVVTKAYLERFFEERFKLFGFGDYQTKSRNVATQTQENGFLLTTFEAGPGSQGALTGFIKDTDSFSPQTDVRDAFTWQFDRGSTTDSPIGSFTLPVQNEKFWRVSTEPFCCGVGFTDTVFYLPIINGSDFGDEEAKNFGTTYLANTDGYVVARYQSMSNFGAGIIEGFSDGSTNPTVKRGRVETFDFGGQAVALAGTFTMPVKAGDYWRVTEETTGGFAALEDRKAVIWIPDNGYFCKDGSVSSFGDWELRGTDTTYEASQDGFVVAFHPDSSGSGELIGRADKNNTPTTLRVAASGASPGRSARSLTMPVPSGYQWKVDFLEEVAGSAPTIFWLPILCP